MSNVNPYLFLPTELAGDPDVAPFRFESLNSPRYYSVYPPASQYVFAVAVWAGQRDWVKSYLALKVLLILFELAGLILLAGIVKRQSLLLYALNPLVIFEVAGQAHTESIALPFIVLAVALTIKQRGLLAGAALGAATMVKLYPALVLPALVRRTGWRSLLGFSIAVLLLSLPLFKIEAVGNAVSSLKLYVRLFEFNAGPYLLLKQVLHLLTGTDFSKQLGPLFGLLGLLGVVWLHTRDRAGRSIADLSVLIFGLLLLLATTVHPWYFVPLLGAIALTNKAAWPWQWLAAFSSGTYLLYSNGPYWLFVWLGWGGALVLLVLLSREAILRALLKQRANQKSKRIRALLSQLNPRVKGDTLYKGDTLIDIGAGEGYVGDRLAQDLGLQVTLTDVRDSNQTSLPFVLSDGSSLSFEDNAFDSALLSFVLHHCGDPERVMLEAVRVSGKGVVIIESTYRSEVGRRLLTILDKLANRLRSEGEMASQELHLKFRTPKEWKRVFEDHGLEVECELEWGSVLHRQVGFIVGKPGPDIPADTTDDGSAQDRPS